MLHVYEYPFSSDDSQTPGEFRAPFFTCLIWKWFIDVFMMLLTLPFIGEEIF